MRETYWSFYYKIVYQFFYYWVFTYRSRKQELKARLWSYDKKIGLHGIINAYEARRTNIDEMADFLDITPEFLRDAIKCYKGKYGHYVILDNYIIFFEPNLSVAKMIWD